MPNFDVCIKKYGEFGVQAIVEQIERVSGIRVNVEAPLSLEVRWNIVMQEPLSHEQNLAA